MELINAKELYAKTKANLYELNKLELHDLISKITAASKKGVFSIEYENLSQSLFDLLREQEYKVICNSDPYAIHKIYTIIWDDKEYDFFVKL